MGADEPDIMTWFPRREDYEDAPVAVMPDETIEEKIDRQERHDNVKCTTFT